MTISRKELAGRMNALTLHLLRRVRGATAEPKLSTARLSALTELVYRGPRTVGELAAAERVTAPTMSRMVTALEREGYVSREDDTADGRRVQVMVTPEGIRALEAARERRVDQLASLLEGIDPPEWETVRQATEILESALGREPEAG